MSIKVKMGGGDLTEPGTSLPWFDFDSIIENIYFPEYGMQDNSNESWSACICIQIQQLNYIQNIKKCDKEQQGLNLYLKKLTCDILEYKYHTQI